MSSRHRDYEPREERQSRDRKEADRDRREQRRKEDYKHRDYDRKDRRRDADRSSARVAKPSDRDSDSSSRQQGSPHRRESTDNDRDRGRDTRGHDRGDPPWLVLQSRDSSRRHRKEHPSRVEERQRHLDSRTDSPLSERNYPAAHASRMQPEKGTRMQRQHAPAGRREREADTAHGRHSPRQHAERQQHTDRARADEATTPAEQPSVAPELDFFSERFDAALALHTPDLQPPNTAVRPLQMLQQCRFILPPELEESLADAEFKQKSQEELEAAKARVGPAAKRRQAAELKHSVVDRIAATVTKGPLLLLKRCFEVGGRVRVVTRHARGVRGTAEGTLMAFDKFMNLVLADVEETYTVRMRIERTETQLRLKPSNAEPSVEAVPGAAYASPEDGASCGYELVERSRTAFKLEQRSRHLKQIFVRGSNVVLVSTAQPKLPGPPPMSTQPSAPNAP